MIIQFDPDHVFTSADKFERLARHEIADMMNGCIEDLPEPLEPFAQTDPRLTDAVCYEFVEWYANCGSKLESTMETLAEYPDIRRK